MCSDTLSHQDLVCPNGVSWDWITLEREGHGSCPCSPWLTLTLSLLQWQHVPVTARLGLRDPPWLP